MRGGAERSALFHEADDGTESYPNYVMLRQIARGTVINARPGKIARYGGE